ncbi:MAG: nitrite/sulfite reductase [Pyrobaculum sp.]
MAQRDVSWDEVYRRNIVERIKRDKHPLKLLEELEELCKRNYHDIPEEEFTRLYWLGVVHDRPRVGYMMVRLRIPGGILTPQQLRKIGEVSMKFGKNYAEITVRQDIQLHWVKLADLPEVFRALSDVGITTLGTEGDTVRNITSCPLAGLLKDEAFDVRPTVFELTKAFINDPVYSDLPRKFKITVTACPYQCSVPEINDLSFIGVDHGYTVLIGGGLSVAPRIAKHLPIIIEPDRVVELTKAILDVWRSEPKYRLSRVRARIKFMIDDLGVDRFRELVEARLGYRLRDYPHRPLPKGKTDHVGVEELIDGSYSVGIAVPAGMLSGELLIRIADLADELDAEIRLTHRQNLLIVGVPGGKVNRVADFARSLGLSTRQSPLDALSIACTGDPYCNFSIGDTKAFLLELIRYIRERIGDREDLPPLHIVGCPHACAWYWIGNIGLMATTLRTQDGAVKKAYDILLGGDYGVDPRIGKPILRRVPVEYVKDCVLYIIQYYLERRSPGEDFARFVSRIDPEDLVKYINERVGLSLSLDRSKPHG